MNSSLLALTASATPAPGLASGSAIAAHSAGTGQAQVTDAADSESASPFAQLLELAAGAQGLQTTGDASAENSEVLSDSEEAVEAVADTSTSEAEALALTSGSIQAAFSELNASLIDGAELSRDVDNVIAAAEAAAVSLVPTMADEAGATDPALALPLAGKGLPLWQLMTPPTAGLTPRQPPITEDAEQKGGEFSTSSLGAGLIGAELSGAALSDTDLSVAGLSGTGLSDKGLSDTALPESWAQLIESASKITSPLRTDGLQTGRTGAELVAAMTSPTNSHATNAANVSDNVPGIALRSPHFASLLGNQVLWQAKVGNSKAEIRLDPPDLGPIDVHISQQDSETHLHFVVSHTTTREQLEQALPRLRELFGQGGLQLGQVAVEQGQRDNASQQSQSQGGGPGKRTDESLRQGEPVTRQLMSTSLIDDYA